jgi:chromosome segregation ATPase
MASGISSDISITSSQLAELAKLVRSRHLFLAEEDTTKINTLVGTVKANIESLHFRLDEAQRVLNEKKKRIPKNSQAGQEATNVVDQLRHEFVQATQGFKRVLQQRSDGMKEVQDRKSAVLGQSDNSSNTNKSIASAVMGNRPPVYGRSHTLESTTLPTAAGRTLIGGSSAMPMLDLSSAYLPATSTDTPGVGDSSMGLHLPRPRE